MSNEDFKRVQEWLLDNTQYFIEIERWKINCYNDGDSIIELGIEDVLSFKVKKGEESTLYQGKINALLLIQETINPVSLSSEQLKDLL